MVYSSGLRRCLIIFAPQALILDRRTGPCQTPSLQLIRQRSKNFTSGVAVSFTLSSPIMFGWCMPPQMAQVPHHKDGPSLTTRGQQQIALSGLQDQHNSNATLGRCFDIPWLDIQPRLVALSTLSLPGCLRWRAPVTGQGLCVTQGHTPVMPNMLWVQHCLDPH
jgi:hypothetical protein